MKKKLGVTLAGAAAAIGLVFVSAGGAWAASIEYGSKDCGWPTHAFVESTTKGTVTHAIMGTNQLGVLDTKPSSSDWKRYYTNSPTEDAEYANVRGYSSIQSGGVGCSI